MNKTDKYLAIVARLRRAYGLTKGITYEQQLQAINSGRWHKYTHLENLAWDKYVKGIAQ